VSLKNQDENYLTGLGLQRDPFSPEADSRFYCSLDSFEQRLKVLQGLVQGSELLVLVIGEPGSGKTTMLNRYLASTETQWEPARILADRDSAATQSSESPAYRGYPAYISKDPANPFVIVDDAHRLPQAELEFLIREALMPGRINKIKRLVLFGESSLYTAVTELAATLSGQPAVNKIYLPGLTEVQTGAYLRHRLTIAGYAGETPFNASQIKRVHQASGGYPGPINQIAQQWLKEKYSTKKEGLPMLERLSAVPKRTVVWIAAGVIVILLASVWLFANRQPATSKRTDQPLTKTVFRQKIVQERQVNIQPAGKKTAAVKTPVKPPAAATTQPAPPAKTPDESSTAITAQPAPPAETPVKSPTAITSQPAPPAERPAEPPASVQVQAAQKEQPIAAKPAISAPQQTDSQPSTSLPRATEPAPVVASPATGEIRREKWLLSQKASAYTVQIIGVSNEKTLLDFVKRNPLVKPNELAYYESTFKGKPWFQLLYGIYPSRQEAQAAADKLPENIQQAGPWIRQVASVQEVIGK
jgi:DamX protein